jgi:hypothetical protein
VVGRSKFSFLRLGAFYALASGAEFRPKAISKTISKAKKDSPRLRFPGSPAGRLLTRCRRRGSAVAALGQTALDNTIVYTAANIPFYGEVRDTQPPIHLDLNNDGITDLTIVAGGSGYSLGSASQSTTRAERGGTLPRAPLRSNGRSPREWKLERSNPSPPMDLYFDP